MDTPARHKMGSQERVLYHITAILVLTHPAAAYSSTLSSNVLNPFIIDLKVVCKTNVG